MINKKDFNYRSKVIAEVTMWCSVKQGELPAPISTIPSFGITLGYRGTNSSFWIFPETKQFTGLAFCFEDNRKNMLTNTIVVHPDRCKIICDKLNYEYDPYFYYAESYYECLTKHSDKLSSSLIEWITFNLHLFEFKV